MVGHKAVWSLAAHAGPVGGIAWQIAASTAPHNPSSSANAANAAAAATFVTCGADGSVRVWDAATRVLMCEMRVPAAAAEAAAAAAAKDGGGMLGHQVHALLQTLRHRRM